MYWYAAEPLAEIDANRALAMAESAKMPKFMTYMIQRIGTIKTPEAKKSLNDLHEKLMKTNSHEQHENRQIIEKLLKE